MKKSNKLLSLLITLALMLTMCFGTVVTSFAEGEAQQETQVTTEEAVLTIIDGRAQAEVADPVAFTETAFNQLKTATYTYSAINNYGTPSKIADVKGVKVKTILAKAGINVDKLDKNATLVFTAGDGYEKSFTVGELFANRYYFANITNEKLKAAYGPVNTKLAEKKTKVEAMISLEEGECNHRVIFGQKYATDRNEPNFNKGVVTIAIQDGKDQKQFDAPIFTTDNAESMDLGSLVDFDATATKGIIYYTTDGSTPNANSYVYNVATKKNNIINQSAVLNKAGKVTVKAVIIGYGKAKSEVASKTFTVKKGVLDPEKVKLSKTTYKYNGKAKKPAVTIEGVSKKNYTVKYSNNVKRGKKACVTITGKQNYKGTVKVYFTIK